MNYYEPFNKKLNEFLVKLIQTYPELAPQLQQLKSAVMLAKNLNEKTPQKIFKTYVNDQYRVQIENKDEAFFLAQSSFGPVDASDNTWGDFIAVLKQIWVDSSQENQAVIWLYMLLLLRLSDKIESKK